jgi:hypothetical protein
MFFGALGGVFTLFFAFPFTIIIIKFFNFKIKINYYYYCSGPLGFWAELIFSI